MPLPKSEIHAKGDPWILAEAYERFDWQAHPALTPLLTKAGGYVGLHGRDTRAAWHDLAAERFFATQGAQRSAEGWRGGSG